MTRTADSPSARSRPAPEGDGGPSDGDGTADAEVRIGPMRAGDVPAVAEIERRAFSVPWEERTFRRLLGAGGTRAWTARAPGGDEVAGYAVMWFRERGAQLGNLAVAAAYRRRGLGRRLVEVALEAARESGARHVILEVRESNEAALRLYRGLGFRLLGRRRNYYRSPEEDALVMGVDAR